jgi:hypothetical protein
LYEYALHMQQQGGSMNAILRKKRQWVFEHERQLVQLTGAIIAVLKDFLARMMMGTSFLLFLIYKMGEIFLCLLHLLLIGPRLVSRKGPNGEFAEIDRNVT